MIQSANFEIGNNSRIPNSEFGVRALSRAPRGGDVDSVLRDISYKPACRPVDRGPNAFIRSSEACLVSTEGSGRAPCGAGHRHAALVTHPSLGPFSSSTLNRCPLLLPSAHLPVTRHSHNPQYQNMSSRGHRGSISYSAPNPNAPADFSQPLLFEVAWEVANKGDSY